MKIERSKSMNIDKEVLDAFKEKENQNEYKYRLLFEYRDIVLKRYKLEKYLEENKANTQNEKEIANFNLLKEQLEVLYKYEEILYTRLRLELTV